MQHVIPDLTNEFLPLGVKVFVHVLRVMNILTAVVQHKAPASSNREGKPETSDMIFVLPSHIVCVFPT
jgi:hypothetical protein